ncbi:MAG TPA: hypothetical protein VFB51_13335 [Solirubrobacterales bacterium]|nr:hypothetical protein [Solirubrobacterales bacterium]
MNTSLSRLSDARAQLGLLAGAFALTTLIAKAAGAEWGTAAGIGQIAFAIALVAVLLRAD